jgi:hypothetical protein
MDPTVRDQLLERMSSFSGDVRALGLLVADLDAVWHTESWSDLARRDFRREWAVLEEIYSSVLEDNRSLKAAEKADVDAALGELRSILLKT